MTSWLRVTGLWLLQDLAGRLKPGTFRADNISTVETIDLLFEEHRRDPFHPRKPSLYKKLGFHLDRRFIYKDEPEYLETPGLPLETQFKVVDVLSKINNRSGYTSIFLRELSSLLAPVIKNHSSTPLKILDIGPGGGGLLKAIHRWAHKKKIKVDLWGVDISDEFRKETQKRLDLQNVPAKLLHGDACDLKHFAEGEFDIVVCNYMVHHLRSASKVAAFLKEVYRISRSGWLIVDFNRKVWGPFFAGLSGFVFGAPWVVNEDGIKSIRRAYKTREMNFILHKLERAGKIKNMTCRSLPLVPYWMIKGRKVPGPF